MAFLRSLKSNASAGSSIISGYRYIIEIYVSGGEGFVYIFQQQDPDRYILLDNIASGKGARTSLYVPEWNQLYVAVPNSSASAAHIKVFRIGDR